ncbi:MAG TPA: GWxTD domain-containing protein [Candidatus Xenobia bacterium]|nr:GWxTD domain-containing protein [Candidatus Xenobia bacterium]
MNSGKPASLALSFLLFAGLAAFSQQPPSEEKKPEAKPQAPISDQLPKRERTKEQREKSEKELRKELGSHFKKWLDEDVAYIITPEEKEAFLRLGTDEEREQFIEQFWLRRDPTPDTPENENREEHYRRIAYANERFSSGKPGWRTDRGRIYIAWGPPDEIESHPSGGAYYREWSEGGGSTSTYPFERWRYRYLEGIGEQIILEFVDPSFSGEYRLTIDPSEKDALLNVPNAGLSFLEEMGIVDKGSRFDRTDGTRLPLRVGELGPGNASRAGFEQFERLRIMAAVMKPPEVKFKDLEELVRTRISFNLLPFETRTDFLRVTDETILVPITISVRKRDCTFKFENGIHRSIVNVFGRITTMTGRTVQTFEDILSVDVPASLFEQTLETPTVYQKALPLRPGLYKLNLVLKDVNSGNIGTMEQRLAVPQFEEGKLAHSTLILADQIERVATKSVGSGQFVIGDTKVRPAVPEDFTRDERLGIYLQVYNLSVSEQTHKPDVVIEYTVQKGDKTVFNHSETTEQLPRVGQQITLEKVLPLGSFEPGEYSLAIRVTDQLTQQTVSPTATFRIIR